jgi:hypothetical protein
MTLALGSAQLVVIANVIYSAPVPVEIAAVPTPPPPTNLNPIVEYVRRTTHASTTEKKFDKKALSLGIRNSLSGRTVYVYRCWKRAQ